MLSSRCVILGLRGLADAVKVVSASNVSTANSNGALAKRIRHRQFHKTAIQLAPVQSNSDNDGTKQEEPIEYEKFTAKAGQLRLEVTSNYSTVDTHIYQMLMDNDMDRASASSMNSSSLPLFLTIPALRAVDTVLKDHLNITMDKLSLVEHNFQSFSNLPHSANELKSIVDFTDIVHSLYGTMIILDVATMNPEGGYLSYNQFCYQLRGVSRIGESVGSRRYVPSVQNHLEDSFPHFSGTVAVSATQDSLMNRLLPPSGSGEHPRPVHPITSLSVIGKAIMERLGIPQEKLKAIKLAFPARLYPDELITYFAWRKNRYEVMFYSTSLSRGEQPHFGGNIQLFP